MSLSFGRCSLRHVNVSATFARRSACGQSHLAERQGRKMKLADHPIFVVLAVAVLAPLLAEMRIGVRVPVVVLEVLLGIVVGPHALGIVEPGVLLVVMKTAGAGAVLFMAGMEIDFSRIRGHPLSLALRGWVASLGLVGLLHVIPDVRAPMMVAIVLATTSLGTLLPILRDGGQLDAPFGRLLLAAGTVGEVGPIVAVSLMLSTRYGTWQTFGLLLVFLLLVAFAAAVGVGARPPKLLALLSRTLNASTQWPVRLVLLLLAGSMLLALELGFEAILGAFAAGMVVGFATHGKDGDLFRAKIDAVSFGWFAPFFFAAAGSDGDHQSPPRAGDPVPPRSLRISMRVQHVIHAREGQHRSWIRRRRPLNRSPEICLQLCRIGIDLPEPLRIAGRVEQDTPIEVLSE